MSCSGSLPAPLPSIDPHVETHVDLGRLDALNVLVELRSAGSTCGRRDLGHRQHQPLQSVTQRIRVGQARSRNRDGTHRQRTFIELRKERAAGHDDARKSGHEHRHRSRHDDTPMRERAHEPRFVPVLQPPRQRAAPRRWRSSSSSAAAMSTGQASRSTRRPAMRSAPRRRRTRVASAAVLRRCRAETAAGTRAPR